MGRAWSRERVVEELYDRQRNGLSLRADALTANQRRVLYSKNNAGHPLYVTLPEARELVAQRFEKEGDTGNALQARQYNAKPTAPNRMNEQAWNERRHDLAERLKKKLANGEDLTPKAQAENDSRFVALCKNAFGTYRGVFDAANIPYNEHVQTPHTRPYYLQALIKRIKDRKPLDRPSVMRDDPKLERSLMLLCNGYYTALEQATTELTMCGEREHAQYANPQQWNVRARADTAHAQKQARMRTIDTSVLYNPRKIRGIQLPHAMDGTSVIAYLKTERGWLTSREVADRTERSPFILYRELPVRFPEFTIKVIQNKCVRYLFDANVVKAAQRTRTANPDSINETARRLGIWTTEAQTILRTLGKVPGKTKLTPDEKRRLEEIVAERHDVARRVAALNANRHYTVGQLEMAGVPGYGVREAGRRGEIPFETEGKTRLFRGADVQAYWGKNATTQQHKLQIIGAYSNLLTIRDIVRQYSIDPGTVRHRFERLVEEMPEAAYRIRNERGTTRILVTAPAAELIANFPRRSEMRLLRELRADNLFVHTRSASAAVENLETLLHTPRLSREQTMEAVGYIQQLEAYARATVPVRSIDMPGAALQLLVQFMEQRRYTTMEVGDSVPLDELRAVAQRTVAVNGVTTRGYEKVLRDNIGLIRMMATKYGKNHSEAENYAIQGFYEAIRQFNPRREKAASFGWFAGKHIRWAILHGLKAEANDELTVSLDEMVGEKQTRSSRIAAEGEAPDTQAIDESGQERIRESFAALSPRERYIVETLFGFGKPAQTLEHIGEGLGITRERVRQIKEKALEKLRSNGVLKRMHEIDFEG